MSYQSFYELCMRNGVTPNKVSNATGVATATLSNWKKGIYTPKMDKMVKLAQYFNVPVEYIATPAEIMGNSDAFLNNNSLYGGLEEPSDYAEALDDIQEALHDIETAMIPFPDYFRYRTLCDDAGFSDSDICNKLEIPEDAISKWHDMIERPSIDIYMKISDFFDVSLDYLLPNNRNWIQHDTSILDEIKKLKQYAKAIKEMSEKKNSKPVFDAIICTNTDQNNSKRIHEPNTEQLMKDFKEWQKHNS